MMAQAPSRECRIPAAIFAASRALMLARYRRERYAAASPLFYFHGTPFIFERHAPR